MAPVMLSAQMAKADATRAKPVLGMPPGFELFRDSFDVLVRDESPLWADHVDFAAPSPTARSTCSPQASPARKHKS